MTPWLILGASLSATVGVERAPSSLDCPSAERLTSAVEAIVGRPLASSEDSKRLSVQVVFTRSEKGYEAHLRLTGAAEGERVLLDRGENCEALADAVAVTLALLFDPAVQSPKAPAPAQPQPARPNPGLWLGARFGLGLGLVEGATWVAGGAFGLSLGARTWFELGAATSGSQALAYGSGVVRVRLSYAELSGFHSVTGGAFQLGPALSILGGVTSGAGEGYATTTRASLAYIALAGGARAQIRLAPRLLLSLRVEGVVPLQNQVFSVGYAGPAYQSSGFALVTDLGLALQIW